MCSDFLCWFHHACLLADSLYLRKKLKLKDTEIQLIASGGEKLCLWLVGVLYAVSICVSGKQIDREDVCCGRSRSCVFPVCHLNANLHCDKLPA